mmetsp:Transcript_76384/g.224049  ORF Transcript_76384/g.224049 Transcript_76384/m.224049 type:complete len:412 (+) Transcript_76384:830-2065(+)
MHVEHVRSGREVVDHNFHSRGVLHREEWDALGAALALCMQQRRLRLLPRANLREHIHSIGGGVRRNTWLERGPSHSHVQDVSDVRLLRLRCGLQVLDHAPPRLQVRVPRRPCHGLRAHAAACGCGWVVAPEQLPRGLSWLLCMPLVVKEGPVLAGVDLGHVWRGCDLEKAGQVVGSRHKVVPGFLVRAHDDIRTLPGMQIKLRQLYWLDVCAINCNERHVVAGDLDLEVLRLSHHADEAEAVALALLYGDQRPWVLLRAVTPLAVPRGFFYLHADWVPRLRPFCAKADVGVLRLVAECHNPLLVIEALVRISLRMDHNGPLQTAVHLHRLHVGVVEARACVASEAIDKVPSLRRDSGLSHAIDAIHERGAPHVQPMPMEHNARFHEVVRDIDTDQLPFNCLNQRPWVLIVD